jgi:hypothetical protein
MKASLLLLLAAIATSIQVSAATPGSLPSPRPLGSPAPADADLMAPAPGIVLAVSTAVEKAPAVGEGLADATGSSAGSTQPATIAGSQSACSKFHPGHYIRIVDSAARNLDGLAALRRTLSSQDLRNFRGVVYQVDWGMLEKSQGVYDFSRIDAALAKVRAKGLYLVLKFQDRTFWTGCSSDFVPSHVAKEGDGGSRYCVAKIWEANTMDQMIRVLQQLAARYQGDPTFLGISLEETAMAPTSFKANWKLGYEQYAQLKRMHQAVHAVAPGLVIVQYLNHPVFQNTKALYDIADNLIEMGGGGGIGWPDTTPSQQLSNDWYQIARDRNRKLLIMAGVETGSIGSSLAETEKAYDMLVNDIGAHAIIWDTWHPELSTYLADRVIPIVNKHNGAVKNKTCPFP